MSSRFTKFITKEQRTIIFNARRALFIYASFHLMMALFLLLYGGVFHVLGLVNLALFPMLFLGLGFWSIGRPYQGFSIAIGALVLCLLLQIYYQNLVGIGVLALVIYYVNQGRITSFSVQKTADGQVDILDAELED
ncbi:MAG: hypothetical protein KTR30_09805 [Saprospiraceae bacterium]|nr:hypothetical protein [Saprospiraceae bacterium]